MTAVPALARWAVLLVATASGSCGLTAFRMTADQRMIPNHWSSAISYPGQDRATRPLAYDSVYVMGPTSYDTVPKAFYHVDWLRFWPGGHVLSQSDHLDAPPAGPITAEQADEWRAAKVGRYAVVGDRLTIEFLTKSEGEMLARYQLLDGRVNADGSITLEGRKVGLIRSALGPYTYRRQVIEGMKRSPDW